MSVFLLPTTIREEIEHVMKSFYWGLKKNGGRSINRLKWDNMTPCKDHGGLKFRDLEGYNLAMLVKQKLKLLTKFPSLLTKAPNAKYIFKNGFLDANIGHSLNFT